MIQLTQQIPEYRTIKELLQEICECYHDSIAFRYVVEKSEQSVSYGQFWQDIIRVAQVLTEKYAKERHIGVLCKVDYACLVMIYGTILAGKTAVLTENTITHEELQELMQRMDTRCLIVPSDKKEVMWEAGCLCTYEEMMHAKTDEMELPKVDADTPAFILFTSGTTGIRHGVILTHQNMTECVRGTYMHKLCAKQPTVLQMLPLYHMYGLMMISVQLYAGATICLNSSLKQLQKELVRYEPQMLACVPMLLEFLYKKINQNIDKNGKRKQFETMRKVTRALKRVHVDISRWAFRSILKPLGGRLEFVICGGAFLDKDIVRFFEDIGIPIYEGYGLTETATFVSVNTQFAYQAGMVGRPAVYDEVRIVDGEVQVRGSNIMKGYYGEEELTRSVMDGEWFKTGDLGEIDKKGFLKLTGRKKNLLILSNGQNVSPEMIEQELLKSDLIDEVLVLEKKGHIHAEIYTEQIQQRTKEELMVELRKEIDARNRRQPRERYVESFDLRKEPFDKTVTMKIKRVQK